MEPNKFGKEAKKVIEIVTEIVNSRGKDYRIRFKDIKNWKKYPGEVNTFQDTSINRGLKVLIESEIILKPDKEKNAYYQLNPDYVYKALKIGRQNSDISELQSFPLKEVINITTKKSKTTIYGLPEDVFYKTKRRTFDDSQEETVKFRHGMKAKDVLGKNFGFPLPVKIGSNSKDSEEQRLEDHADFYLKMVKEGGRFAKKNKKERVIKVNENSIKEMIKLIINTHRNSNIQLYELGEYISDYLVELKRDYRRKKLREVLEEELKALPKGKLKHNIARFKEAFIGILSHTDHDEEFLKKSIFEFYGQGVGGYSFATNPEGYIKFNKFINLLNKNERKRLFDFNWKIFQECIGLYPTHTAFICRGHSVDIFPEEIPLNIGNK